ncbi:hypothetical protein TrVE_jg7540 [Triparma verrucosa]|uniref:MOSC domain-containing protein n=1 Tax=Triparma verrucosa TaxID=1606542 RepID=A0A9W7BPL6_9STRA|nr:hypothetical protein TrVE_jg7540 [Triparma verrucosa]
MRNFPTLASISVSLDTTEGNPSKVTLTSPLDKSNTVTFSLNPSPNELAPKAIAVECGGASTTSAGSWHLGVVENCRSLRAPSAWLNEILNSELVDRPKRSKPLGEYHLVMFSTTESAGRDLSRYAGPFQMPFSEDVEKQRIGEASPFKFQKVPVVKDDKIAFQDVAPINLLSLVSFRDLQENILKQSTVEDKKDEAFVEAVKSYSPRVFRPNIIVDGGKLKKYDEETWSKFKLGEVDFRGLKPCPRCSVPARNPKTGEMHYPNSSLSRLAPQKVMRTMFPEKCIDDEWGVEWQGTIFSMHVGANDAEGQVIRVGDEITVKERKGGCSIVRKIGTILFLFIALTWMALDSANKLAPN